MTRPLLRRQSVIRNQESPASGVLHDHRRRVVGHGVALCQLRLTMRQQDSCAIAPSPPVIAVCASRFLRARAQTGQTRIGKPHRHVQADNLLAIAWRYVHNADHWTPLSASHVLLSFTVHNRAFSCCQRVELR